MRTVTQDKEPAFGHLGNQHHYKSLSNLVSPTRHLGRAKIKAALPSRDPPEKDYENQDSVSSSLTSTFQHPIYRAFASPPSLSGRTLATIKEFNLTSKESKVLFHEKDHSEANKVVALNFK